MEGGGEKGKEEGGGEGGRETGKGGEEGEEEEEEENLLPGRQDLKTERQEPARPGLSGVQLPRSGPSLSPARSHTLS